MTQIIRTKINLYFRATEALYPSLLIVDIVLIYLNILYMNYVTLVF